MLGHKTEHYGELKHKIKNFINERVTTIDLLNQKYEINNHSKADYANQPNPRCYSSVNPGPSNSQAKGQQNEYAYEPEKLGSNNPWFEAVFMNSDEKSESINERKGREIRIKETNLEEKWKRKRWI